MTFTNRLICIIAITLLPLYLSSCQRIIELRVAYNGSTTPRNHREKMIFDYWNALKERNYSYAYSLLDDAYEQDGLNYPLFIKKMEERRKFLPTTISIGREIFFRPSDTYCGYRYVVYLASQKGEVLQSGELSLEASDNNPKDCKIAYNSAFGPY